MKSTHTHQLGPWSNHEQINFGSRQFYKMNANKQTNSPRKLILPKLAKILSSTKHIQVKLKEIKQKNQEQLKMNSLRINSNATDLSQARKSRTLSFNPPMISFYNEKHPKIKKIKQRNNLKLKSFFNEKELDSKQTQIQNSVNKINLLQQRPGSKKELNLALKEQHKHQALNDRSSFRRLINLLNQSDNNQSWTQRTKSYFCKQKLNGINRYLKSNNNISMDSINQQTFYPYRQTEKKLYFKRQNSFQGNLNRSK